MKIDNIMIRTLARLGQTRASASVALPEVLSEKANILIVTSDLAFSSGMDKIVTQHPDRIINVGIAEQNMISISSGLAAEGFCVYAVTYASFVASRSIEQVKLNILATKANVKIIGIWSGVSLALGISHYATEDIAFMRSLPGMIILSPADSLEAYKMTIAASNLDQPVYIRLNGGMESPIIYKEDYEFIIGKPVLLREGEDVAMIATGLMVYESLKAAQMLMEKGVSCAVYNFHTINPIDTDTLDTIFAKYKLIVTVEEHAMKGGLGGAVAEYKSVFANMPRQVFIGLPDYYVQAGYQEYMWDIAGLTGQKICQRIFDEFADERML